MKNVFSILAVASVLAFAAPAFAAAETYTLDPTHTNITWHANHLGFSNPSGKFATVEGTLILDEAAPQNSRVDVTVTPASIVTGIEKFDTHLRSADFFDVDKFPTATFVSDKVEVAADGRTAKVHGKLALHGVTKPVVLDVTLNKIAPNPMSNKKTAGFSATTTIKRSEFGMTYGVPNVSDDVKVSIEAEAIIKE